MKKVNITKKIINMLSYASVQYMFDCFLENVGFCDCYVDDEKNTKCCAVVKGYFVFLGGVITKEFLNELFYVDNKWFEIGVAFYDGSDIIPLFPNVYKTHKNERSLYKYKECNLDYDIYLTKITKKIINSNIENTSIIKDEIINTHTFNDLDDFYNRGIGYTYIENNSIKSFCTSEYPSKDSIAIGIEVVEEYQRKGIATAMTKAFVSEAKKRNLNIYWECWAKNYPSYKTALKCGFEKVSDYPIIFFEYDESKTDF